MSFVPVSDATRGPSSISAYVKLADHDFGGKPAVHVFFQRRGSGGRITEKVRSLDNPGTWIEKLPDDLAGSTRIPQAFPAGIGAAIVEKERSEPGEFEILFLSG